MSKKTTIDFEQWHSMYDNDKYDTYYLVQDLESEESGQSNVKITKTDNGGYILDCDHIDENLSLTDKNKNAFLAFLNKKCEEDGFGDWESWNGYNRAMDNDD